MNKSRPREPHSRQKPVLADELMKERGCKMQSDQGYQKFGKKTVRKARCKLPKIRREPGAWLTENDGRQARLDSDSDPATDHDDDADIHRSMIKDGQPIK
jgi:hypothetical protein